MWIFLNAIPKLHIMEPTNQVKHYLTNIKHFQHVSLFPKKMPDSKSFSGDQTKSILELVNHLSTIVEP